MYDDVHLTALFALSKKKYYRSQCGDCCTWALLLVSVLRDGRFSYKETSLSKGGVDVDTGMAYVARYDIVGCCRVRRPSTAMTPTIFNIY